MDRAEIPLRYNKDPVLNRLWTGKPGVAAVFTIALVFGIHVYRASMQSFTANEAHNNLFISNYFSSTLVECPAGNHVLESRLLSPGYTGSSEAQLESRRHA